MTRESMVFPFRWFDSLLELEADLPVMLAAIRQYAENGEEPKFKGAMAGLWREYKDRIDADTGKYAARCERNRDNIKKRWTRTDTKPYQSIPKHTKNTDGEGEGEGEGKVDNLKETILSDGKEKAPADASATTTTTIIESSILPIADFGKWSKEQFTRSVASAVADHPEYKSVVEAFSQYWLEPDRRGRFRFALEKTWSTAGRLATWYKRESPARSSPPPTAGWHRDPKTGVVRGISDEEQILEFRKREGF